MLRICLALLITPIFSFSQESKRRTNSVYPFQVLFAEHTTSSTNQKLGSLEFIGSNEYVTLKNGYLSLMHYSGILSEFKGDTTISVYALNQLLIDSLQITESHRTIRPYLEYLFIDSSRQAKKFLLSITGAHFDGAENLVPIVGKTFHKNLLFENPICLYWRSPLRGKFTIQINNSQPIEVIDDKVLSSFYQNDSTQHLNIGAHGELKISHPNSGSTITLNLMRYPLKSIPFPFSCRPKTASQAINMAMLLEMKSIESPTQALMFYQKAVELSNNHPFFQKMFSNAHKRAGLK